MTESAPETPAGRSTTSRTPRIGPGEVELAADRTLVEIDTDHAAADLLTAMAKSFARDVDRAKEVRDRVAASKELREILRDLDTAIVPPRTPPAPAAEGGAPDAAAADDDPFAIGSRPPELGDSA